MIFVSILLILVVVLLTILSFIWPPDSPWAPQWRTSRSAAHRLLTLASVEKNDIVYELGSGDGEVIVSAAQDFGAQSVGVEIDPVRALISVIRIKFRRASSQVQVIRKDFKQVDLSPATVIYMYLVPAGMKRLLPQLKKQLNPGTRIISYRYKIPLSPKEKTILFVKEDTKEKIFLYTVSQSTEKD